MGSTKHRQRKTSKLRASTKMKGAEEVPSSQLSEHKRNQLALMANERFLQSGITMRDVYGKLRKGQ